MSKGVWTQIFTLTFLLTLIQSVPLSSLWAADSKSTQVVQVMGMGNIIDEDTSNAKDQAISNALIAAVEDALISKIPNRIVVSNFATINDIVYGNTDTFIQGYRVLAETRMDRKYKVMVQATVSTEKIQDSLIKAGIVLDPANKYKILLLVSENNLEELAPQFWWANGGSYVKTVSDDTISDTLQKKGFDVLKHRLINQNLIQGTMDSGSLDEVLSTDMALAIGRSFGADIIITGTAHAEQALNSMGNDRSYSGLVSLTIYKTDNGEKIGSVMQKAVDVNTDESMGSREALVEASKLAAGDLASTINMAMKQEENKPTMIEVVIEGTDFFVNYARLTRKLQELSGVKRVKQREKHKDTAIVIVDFVGNGKNLAKALMEETFEHFGLHISEVTRNRMRLEMIPLNTQIYEQ